MPKEYLSEKSPLIDSQKSKKNLKKTPKNESYRVFPGNLQKQISNKQTISRSFSGALGLF